MLFHFLPLFHLSMDVITITSTNKIPIIILNLRKKFFLIYDNLWAFLGFFMMICDRFWGFYGSFIVTPIRAFK